MLEVWKTCMEMLAYHAIQYAKVLTLDQLTAGNATSTSMHRDFTSSFDKDMYGES